MSVSRVADDSPIGSNSDVCGHDRVGQHAGQGLGHRPALQRRGALEPLSLPQDEQPAVGTREPLRRLGSAGERAAPVRAAPGRSPGACGHGRDRGARGRAGSVGRRRSRSGHPRPDGGRGVAGRRSGPVRLPGGPVAPRAAGTAQRPRPAAGSAGSSARGSDRIRGRLAHPCTLLARRWRDPGCRARPRPRAGDPWPAAPGRPARLGPHARDGHRYGHRGGPLPSRRPADHPRIDHEAGHRGVRP